MRKTCRRSSLIIHCDVSRSTTESVAAKELEVLKVSADVIAKVERRTVSRNKIAIKEKPLADFVGRGFCVGLSIVTYK